ncbi:MAG: magnesium/cobalt transporter CorA [Thermoleophilia bacterium]
MSKVPRHFLVDARGSSDRVDRTLVQRSIDDGEFFWLDLHQPSADEIDMLDELFALHPLAVEDISHFGQRPKVDDYDDIAMLVAYGANGDRDGLVEVHCFIAEKFLITVHRDECPPFEELRLRATREPFLRLHNAQLLHAITDALADSFFPELSRLDDRIDALEAAMLGRPSDVQLQEIFHLKRRLISWRKVITAQRDLFATLVAGAVELPGASVGSDRYFRDVYDHLIRISDLVDSYRDLLSGAMDLYLSTVSNRLNEVMKRLTIVATVFMPLTWITGFFGMNFPALVTAVGGWPMFILLGIATQGAAVAAMLVYFRRRGWM